MYPVMKIQKYCKFSILVKQLYIQNGLIRIHNNELSHFNGFGQNCTEIILLESVIRETRAE